VKNFGYDMKKFTYNFYRLTICFFVWVILFSYKVFSNGCTGSWFDIQYSPWCDCWQVCGNYISDCDKIKSITWNFGDGTTYSGPDPCHKYQQPGNYTITMTIVAYCHNSFFGLFTQTCNITKQLNVPNTAPVIGANFSADTVCLGQVTQFQNTSSGSFGTNVYLWDFGDGTTGSGPAPQHQYDSCGAYDVRLIVHNTTPCCSLSGRDTVIKRVYVNCPPNEVSNAKGKTDPYIQESTADVEILSGTCLGDTTSFNLVTTGPIASWQYIFPDSSISTLRNPRYVYTNCPPAIGFTKLIVQTNRGCKNVIDSITGIFCPNNVRLRSTTTLCTGSCNGTATAIMSGGTPPYSIVWNDPQSQTTFTAINLCPGQYKPTVTDGNGCTASPNPVTVDDFPYPFVGTATVYGNIPCNGWNGGSAILNMTGGTPPYSYYWSPSGDTTADAQNLPRVNTVTATDANGCTFTTTVIIPEPDPIGANFLVNDASCGVCNGSITVSGTGGTGAYVYRWFTSPVQLSPSINNLCAGLYRVEVEDGGVAGCKDTFSIPLSEIGAQPISISSVSALCNGQCNGSATVQLTGGCLQPPCSFAWFDSTNSLLGVTSATAANLCSGSYTVRVTNGLGCRSFATALIGTQTSVQTTTSALPNSCGSNCSGMANVTAAGGSGVFSYQWYDNNGVALPGQTNAIASQLCAAKYRVRVVDSQGCFDWDSVVVGTNNLIANVSTHPAICYGDCNGSVSAITLKGNPPYSYSLTNSMGNIVYAGASFIMANLCADSYTLRIRDSSNCVLTFPVNVHQPDSFILQMSITAPLCFGDCNGAIIVNSAGGTPPYSYVWTNSSGTNIGNANSVQNLCSGNYALQLTDSNGCAAPLMPVSIVQPTRLRDSLVKAFPYCDGNLGYIHAIPSGGSPPYNYQWNTGATTSLIQGLDTGFYRVTITDFNGCIVIDSARFNFIPPLQVQVYTEWYNGYHFKCNEGSLTYLKSSATGGVPPYTFQWNDSLNSTTDSLYGVPPGVYVVTVTDQLGCSKTDTLNLYLVPPKMYVSHAESHVSCFGKNDGRIHVSISGGVPSYNIFWEHDPFLKDTILNGLSPGVYVYNVIDTNICFFSDTVIITEPIPLSTSLGKTDASCFGASDGMAWASAQGGTPPYTYSWNNHSFSGDTISGIPAGSYVVSVRDSQQCLKIDSILVSQPDSIRLQITRVAALCYGLNGSLILTVQHAQGALSYSWSNGSTTKDIQAPAGNYSVTVTDSRLCTGSAMAQITQPDSLLVNAIVQDVLCAGGSTGSVLLNISGGTSPYAFIWSTGWQQKDLQQATQGNYTVTVSDVNSCSKVHSYFISEPPALQLTLLADSASCYGAATGSITSNYSGGTPPYSYIWSNGVSADNIQNVVAGTYSLTLTDNNNCQITQSAVVHEPSAIQALFTISNISCYGAQDGSIAVAVNGGRPPYLLSWNSGFSNDDTLSGLAAGEYSLVITDTENCTQSFVATIIEPALITAMRDIYICRGDSFFVAGDFRKENGVFWDTLTAGNGCDSILRTNLYVADSHLIYLYDTICYGESYAFNGQILTVSGNYFARLKNVYGCDSSVHLQLTVLPPIHLQVQPNYLLMEYNEKKEVEVKVNPNTRVVSYLWEPLKNLSCINCTNPTVIATADIRYVVTSYDFFGCTDTAHLTVKLKDPEFYVPNMFSPNGDGVNDLFFVYGINIVEFNLKIFNRWGEKVFESNDLKIGWDGTQNGVELPPDVFVYLIEAKFANDFEPAAYKLKNKGSVTLVR
jgi:gliding motility-associated-like protein